MVTVKIKENSKQAKAFLEFIKDLTFVEIIEPKEKTTKKAYPVSKNIPNAETIKAIEDAINGNVYRAKNVKDLMRHLNS